MAARSVQISIDEELLREIDRRPETRKHGRSALIRNALRKYLAAEREKAIDAAYARAYAEKPVGDEFDGLMKSQAWPEDPWPDVK